MKRLWLALTVGALAFWACEDSASSVSSGDEVSVETSSSEEPPESSSEKVKAESSVSENVKARSSSGKVGAKSSSSATSSSSEKAESKLSSAKAEVEPSSVAADTVTSSSSVAAGSVTSSSKVPVETSAESALKSSSSSKGVAKSSSSAAGAVTSSSKVPVETSAESAPRSSSSEKVPDAESSSSVVPLYSDVDTLYSGYFKMDRKDGCSIGKEPPVTTAAFISEGAETLLKVEDVLGDCLDSAMYAMSRVGDTLLVFWDENNLVTNCVCTSDHVFKVSAKETDAKVVKYVTWWGGNWHNHDVFKISSEPKPSESSSSIEPISSSETAPADEPDVLVDVNKYGYAIGVCGGDSYDTGVKALAKAKPVDNVSIGEYVELKKGYILDDGNNHYQVMLPEASDYCDVEAKVKMKRDSDTLFIAYDFGESEFASKCRCLSDHWFDIGVEYADVKYVSFDNQLFQIVEK